MTGTEIMIDGVDVSLCELLTKDNYCSDDAPCNVVVCVYKFNKIKDKLTETLDENRVLEDRLDYIAEILEPYENEFEKEIKYLPEAIKTILKRQKEESEKFYNDGQTEITKLCGRLQQKDKEIDELKQKYLELKEQQNDSFWGRTCARQKQQLDQLKAENERLKDFQKMLEEQMKFNKSELELSLSSEIKRTDFLLKEFKKVDTQRDNWREKAEKHKQVLEKVREYVIKTGIDHKWDMRFQRWKNEILQICDEVEKDR